VFLLISRADYRKRHREATASPSMMHERERRWPSLSDDAEAVRFDLARRRLFGWAGQAGLAEVGEGYATQRHAL
jgi:hypothetical protein